MTLTSEEFTLTPAGTGIRGDAPAVCRRSGTMVPAHDEFTLIPAGSDIRADSPALCRRSGTMVPANDEFTLIPAGICIRGDTPAVCRRSGTMVPANDESHSYQPGSASGVTPRQSAGGVGPWSQLTMSHTHTSRDLHPG